MRGSGLIFLSAILAWSLPGCSHAPKDTVNAASGAKLEVEFNAETKTTHITNKDQNVILDIYCPAGKKGDLDKITSAVRDYNFKSIDAWDSKAAVERLAKSPNTGTGDCPVLSASFNIEHGPEKKSTAFTLSQDAKGTITASLDPGTEGNRNMKLISVKVGKGTSGQCAAEWKDEATLKEFANELSKISETFNQSLSTEGGYQKTLSV
jgi:hypothetical protein